MSQSLQTLLKGLAHCARGVGEGIVRDCAIVVWLRRGIVPVVQTVVMGDYQGPKVFPYHNRNPLRLMPGAESDYETGGM